MVFFSTKEYDTYIQMVDMEEIKLKAKEKNPNIIFKNNFMIS